MRQLELLAPARDAEIGIAAIDCGADAVYIAGPQFGARQAAGNDISQIRRLCDHAHKYGARIFVALNTILYDDELEAAYKQMLAVQEAGADALIIQDMAILELARNGIGNIREDFRIPLHASTQCAIRTPEHARFLESLGFSRLILERELSLEQIRAIRDAVSCELEFFVHGALCVCYSGQCYLSEHIAGRSANRGACIQACRSRYDLVDASGKVLVRDKALLSLKDYNLRERLADLAEAGITSFKIEGRLKNESYVRNIVRYHSMALDALAARHPDLYERGSFGKIRGGFVPDPYKTFNRGYTELYLDGKRGKWAAMDAAKSMGEEIGTVTGISRGTISLKLRDKGVVIRRKGRGHNRIQRRCMRRQHHKMQGCTGSVRRCKAVQEHQCSFRKGSGKAGMHQGDQRFRRYGNPFRIRVLEGHSIGFERGRTQCIQGLCHRGRAGTQSRKDGRNYPRPAWKDRRALQFLFQRTDCSGRHPFHECIRTERHAQRARRDV